MSLDAGVIDGFLDSINPKKLDDAKTIIQMLQNKYPQAGAMGCWDMVVFEVHGTVVAGISVKDDFGILIPHSGLVRKYLPRLGKVRNENGCLRFNTLQDINMEELGLLINEIGIRLFSRE